MSGGPSRRFDGTAGLIAGGVVLLLAGLGCMFLAAISLLASVLVPGLDADPAATLPQAAMLVILAVALVAIGVGSMRARCWALSVALAVSWLWLVTGIVTAMLTILLLPAMLRQAAPELDGSGAIVAAAAIVVWSIVLVSGVVAPGLLVLLYRRSDVVATCRRSDPTSSWVDRQPQPVVTLAVLYAMCGVSVLGMGGYGWVMPFGGVVLGGTAGAAAWATAGIGCAVLAIVSVGRKRWAWHAGAAAAVVAAIGSSLTLARVSLGDILAQVPALRSATGEAMLTVDTPSSLVVAVNLAVWAMFLGYLATVKKHFRR